MKAITAPKLFVIKISKYLSPYLTYSIVLLFVAIPFYKSFSKKWRICLHIFLKILLCRAQAKFKIKISHLSRRRWISIFRNFIKQAFGNKSVNFFMHFPLVSENVSHEKLFIKGKRKKNLCWTLNSSRLRDFFVLSWDYELKMLFYFHFLLLAKLETDLHANIAAIFLSIPKNNYKLFTHLKPKPCLLYRVHCMNNTKSYYIVHIN